MIKYTYSSRRLSEAFRITSDDEMALFAITIPELETFLDPGEMLALEGFLEPIAMIFGPDETIGFVAVDIF